MQERHRLRVIRFTSWYHISWGMALYAFMLMGDFERYRPFGSLEPYFMWVGVKWTAFLFIGCGLVSWMGLKLWHFPIMRRASIFWILPQQALLLWGTLWLLTALIQGRANGLEPRGLLSCLQLGGLSYFHGREVIEVWTEFFRPSSRA